MMTMMAAEQVTSDITFQNYEPLALHTGAAATLPQFFARPVKIATLTISLAGSSGNFDPFSLWRNVASVKEKLSRYGYFKGNMRVALVANGNPFQYGSLVVGLRSVPIDLSNSAAFDHPTIRTGVIWNSDPTTIGSAQLFQMPHVVLDPGAEADMIVTSPLMSTAQWLPLTTALPHAPTVMYYVCPDLANASGSAITPWVISIYASVESAEVAVPVIQAQSGEMKSAGVLQATATAIAGAAAAFKPIFPAWSTSIQAAALVGAKIAGILGLSRPLALDFDPVVATAFSTFAYATGGRVVAHGVGVDPLRSVAMGAQVAGYGSDDDTSLLKIASRWGLVGSFVIATTNVANDVLFSTWVHASNTPSTTIATVVNYLPTPYAYATLPFSTWGGGTHYRFVFNASNFHKGTVRIVYDPTGTATPASVSTADQSLLQTTVVHVNGTTTVDFEVPWSQPTLFVKTQAFSAVGSGGNGRLHVFLDTPLQCNGIAAPVYVRVMVRAAPDLRVGLPSLALANAYAPYLVAQSGTITAPVPKPFLVTYGETISDVSALARRLTYAGTTVLSAVQFASSNWEYNLWTLPAFMWLRDRTVTDANSFTMPWTFCSYFEALFMIQRGGHRMGLCTDSSFATTTSNINGSNYSITVSGANTIGNVGGNGYPFGAAVNTTRNGAYCFNSSCVGGTPATTGYGVYEIGPTHHGFFRVANCGINSGAYPPNGGTGTGSTFTIAMVSQLFDNATVSAQVYYGGADDYRLFVQDITPALLIL
jgi:hypothetical protein